MYSVDLFDDKKVGIFYIADYLATKTKLPRIVWLQRIATAIGISPKRMDKGLAIGYLEFRAMESEGIETLKALSEGSFSHEPENIIRLLSTIKLESRQIVSWLKNSWGIELIGDSPVLVQTKEKLITRAKDCLASHSLGSDEEKVDLLCEKFGRFPNGLSDRQIAMLLGYGGSDSKRRAINRLIPKKYKKK